MTIYALPDITGDNATHVLAIPVRAKWFGVTPTGGAARIGLNADSSHGQVIPQNAIFDAQPDGSDITANYFQVTLYVPSGTTVTASYAA